MSSKNNSGSSAGPLLIVSDGAAALAIDRGARCLEKHFTTDKSSLVIRDHALSTTPEEFRLLADQVREVVG